MPGVFVVSVVVMYVALLLLSGVVLSGSCGPNCYTDVYLDAGYCLVGLAVCVAVTIVVVGVVAQDTSPHPSLVGGGGAGDEYPS